MSDKDIVEEARDLAIRLGHDRKSAFCKAVTHKAIEAEAQNLINRLADEVERLRKQQKEFITRCVCGVLSRTGQCEHLQEQEAKQS